MDLQELRTAARLIDRLAKRALFAEKQMVALEGQCAERRRIADELKAERNALRSTTIDTAAGSLLDAFGSLANEPRNGAPDAEYRDRIVTTIHAIKLERDALKKERDDLWQREGIEQKRRIDVEQERDALRAQLDTERERHKQKPVDSASRDYMELRREIDCALKDQEALRAEEATHITPAGKETAQAAAEPKPGDVVRLVRNPQPGPDFDGFIDFPWNTDWGVAGDVATVVATLAPPNLPVVAVRVSSGIVVWWPLSCVEIVKGGE